MLISVHCIRAHLIYGYVKKKNSIAKKVFLFFFFFIYFGCVCKRKRRKKILIGPHCRCRYFNNEKKKQQSIVGKYLHRFCKKQKQNFVYCKIFPIRFSIFFLFLFCCWLNTQHTIGYVQNIEHTQWGDNNQK